MDALFRLEQRIDARLGMVNIGTTDETGAIVNNLLDRASEAYASLEALLINEIVAGNVIASTPMAACGRVVLGVACAVTRSYLRGQLVSDGTAQDC